MPVRQFVCVVEEERWKKIEEMEEDQEREIHGGNRKGEREKLD